MEKAQKTRRAKGEGTINLQPDGRWRARINFGIDMFGKRIRRSIYAPTKAECVKKMREMLAAKADGHLPVANAETKTFGEYLTMWVEDIAKPSISSKTYLGYENSIRKYIAPYLGHLPLQKITPIHIQKLYGELSKQGIGDRTRQLVHVTITGALGRAVKLELIPKNPAEMVDKPRYQRGEVRALSPKQVEELLSAAEGDRLYHYYVVAITTGMRPGEQAALKWSDINFDNGTLSVRRRIGYSARTVTIDEPKTASGRRRIDLTDRAITALHAQKEQNARENLAKCEWVFPELDGEPLRVYFGLTRFKAVLAKTSIGHLKLYELRHTFATLSLIAGIPLKVVSEMLGHASIQITADTYQHILPTMQKEAIGKLNLLFLRGQDANIGDKIGDKP